MFRLSRSLISTTKPPSAIWRKPRSPATIRIERKPEEGEEAKQYFEEGEEARKPRYLQLRERKPRPRHNMRGRGGEGHLQQFEEGEETH